MPLISAIGRKSPSVRVLIASIYAVLIIGGISMVYPLVLMISGSIKGSIDQEEIDMVPGFLRNETVFFRRYVESKYAALGTLNDSWGTDFLDWRKVGIPAPISDRQAADFDEFRRTTEWPALWTMLGHAGLPARNLRGFKKEISRGADGDLLRAGELLDLNFKSWAEVTPRQFSMSRALNPPSRIVERSKQYQQTRPVDEWILFDVEPYWKTSSLFAKYERKIETYRKRTGSNAKDWSEVHLTPLPPAATHPLVREDWETFVRQKAPLAFLRVDASAAKLFHDYIRHTYGDDLQRLNKTYGTQYRAFEEIPLDPTQSFTGAGFVDYTRFLRETAPIEALSLDGPTFRYRDYLRIKFHDDVAAANAAYRVTWKNFDEASLPIAAMDWRDFQKEKPKWRWEFVVRNYDYVLDFLARHGRGFQNTFILIFLFLVTHLTVNPLAAYALSRFSLPSTYKILLFCMATVAFPGEVMMIPSFLQLKEFGLLNTFAALVLPSLASGYSIFLLKGFFDSLPRELYESATIDGASEWTIFWNITMSLSKPILAVMALGSFTAAYGTFFYALIICPDQKMWTLMVWLYQLQFTSGSQAINYAALCLASIPTMLVFVFCQRIILRGIVVPVEK